MGLIETVAEVLRRAETGDDWYVTERPYALELAVPGIPAAVFAFPLGPENYQVSRVFRQSVTPTVGGLIAEERGLLWRELTISGVFGLVPKAAWDTSQDPEQTIAPLVTKLSGPMWTRRLLRNVFEKYAEFKADPELGADTRLVWHDTKTDDHWVVVPIQVDVNREPARRMQYPFSLKLRAIADAEKIVIPPSKSSLLDKVQAVVAAINAALRTVASAVQELSAITGEIRYFVATVDQVFTMVATIQSGLQDFVDGVTSTLDSIRDVLDDAAALFDEAEAALETAEQNGSIPTEVRHAFVEISRGIDSVRAQKSAFGRRYGDEAEDIERAESGAARTSEDALDAAAEEGPATSAGEFASRTVRSTDAERVAAGLTEPGRVFAKYTAFRDYTVKATDTLQSIAAVELGDGSLWYDLAIINGLQAPYITETGAPGTVAPGAVISVPIVGEAAATAIAVPGTEPGEEILGTDIMLDEVEESAPGRPVIDIAIDRSTDKDVKTISGFGNLRQAIQMRLWTERGSAPLIPEYGLPRVVGYGSTEANLSALRVAVRQTLLADSRVQSISRMSFVVNGDLVEVDADVLPIGTETARTVSASLA